MPAKETEGQDLATEIQVNCDLDVIKVVFEIFSLQVADLQLKAITSGIYEELSLHLC